MWIQCPACQGQFRSDLSAGDVELKCPKCGHSFSGDSDAPSDGDIQWEEVSDEDAVATSDEYNDEVSYLVRRQFGVRLLGNTALFAGVAIVILGTISLASLKFRPVKTLDSAALFVGLMVLPGSFLFVPLSVLEFVARIRCAAGPHESPGRASGLLSIGLTVAMWVSIVIEFFVFANAHSGEEDALVIFGIAVLILAGLSYLTLLGSLCATAVHVERNSLCVWMCLACLFWGVTMGVALIADHLHLLVRLALALIALGPIVRVLRHLEFAIWQARVSLVSCDD